MNDKPPYGKWSGVLLGFLLAGSAHYLSGRRRAGLTWYFAFFAMSVLVIVLLVVPGSVPYFSCLSILLVGTILCLVMLKQSYTPVPRIGVLGWIGVVALSIILSNTKRGDLLLFKTDGLTKLSKGEVWLKRIAGLPGERIRIEPPYLILKVHA
jgi:Signal peptidase, peptidase S26